MRGIMSFRSWEDDSNYCNQDAGIMRWELDADELVEDEVVWPVEHPTEPLDEDRPVKCPIPTSSFSTNTATHLPHLHAVKMEGRRSIHNHRRSVESWRKRCTTKNPSTAMPIAIDQKADDNDDDGVVLELAEADRNRAVRKRHHTLSQHRQSGGEHPHYNYHPSEDVLRRMASLPPTTSTTNNTIFHMLQRASPY